MRIVESDVADAMVIEIDRIEDERGYFARVWDDQEFARAGMTVPWRQANVGFSERVGTLRGMHYQAAPAAEWKLVRCTRGSVFDVAVDLRPESRSRGNWVGFELSAENGRMLLIPPGCGHGYMTLEAQSEIIYLTSAAYAPELAGGVRWDDPRFGIAWPAVPTVISPQDSTWPDWQQPGPGGKQ
jgi:dTDP-4-dehydrorhamnose 3,5-epimerase